MRYFHSTRHRPYQNFRPVSHLISPRCSQPDRVHVGKAMIIIALFWLAVRVEGGVLLLDLLGKGRGAFCLRVLRRKYFDVSNRWYAPALLRRKSQNGGGFNKFFGGVSLRNLCKRVRKSTKWFRSLVESPNQARSEGQGLNKRSRLDNLFLSTQLM